MKDADPYGDFIFDKVNQHRCDILLSIGRNDKRFRSTFWVDSDGWIAGYGYGAHQGISGKSRIQNPVGACFAAAQINSSIFKEYIGITAISNFQKWYSLFNYQSANSPDALVNPSIGEKINFGRVWQIGCGAVGSSFDFLLSLMNGSGIINTVDFDQVKIPNTSSSLLFTAEEAFNGIKKVTTCNFALSLNKEFLLDPIDGDFNDLIKSRDFEDNYPDVILCFANERNIWSSIQFNCPPLVLHATTSKNWGINFGRHIPFKEWCIVCRFGMVQLDSTPTCAEGSAKNEQGDDEILGILPFLAPAAAVQVLAEMIKLNMIHEYPLNKNFLQFSLRNNGMSQFQLQQMSPKIDCPVCSGHSRSDYPESIRQKILGKFK
nr:ThiF family adenylyltransferase [Nitrosomonas nitrosa]